MKVLFLCTGNYYRSRFAEYYFRHLAEAAQLRWETDSRGLALDPFNTGVMSRYTLAECRRREIAIDENRFPLDLTEGDLVTSTLVIAVKEVEHRPLMKRRFPDWQDKIEYWGVHDLDAAPPEIALPELATHVEQLVERLKSHDERRLA